MTKPPTQEEIDNNPALAAIQALKYEDEDPVGEHGVLIKIYIKILIKQA